MCRGFQQQQQNNLLKIKAFYIRLLCPHNSINNVVFPDSLTLHYLPRINASPLVIDHLSLRPHSPAFLTLHRVLATARENNTSKGGCSVFYGCRERVGVSEGVKFEVYLGEDKVVRGFFTKDEEGEWKLELKCGLENGGGGVMVDIMKEVQVCVAAEGGVKMSEKVEMVVKRRYCFQGLEEIPEEREGEMVEEQEEGCCDSSVGGGEVEESGGTGDGEMEAEMEMEMEGVRWALDVGIWVTCLGVGCLLSIASSKRLLTTTRFNFIK